MTGTGDSILSEKLTVFCSLCRKSCQGSNNFGIDRELAVTGMNILHDDLPAFFEYFRLHSQPEKVICNFRDFIHWVVTEKKQLKWFNGSEKRFTNIPPAIFVKYLTIALKRWKYEIPEDFTEAIVRVLSIVDNKKFLLHEQQHYLPQSRVRKFLETDCPTCGKIIKTELDESELENLARGTRILHKAVQHGNGSNSHVINLLIDSHYNIRRKTAATIAKAVS